MSRLPIVTVRSSFAGVLAAGAAFCMVAVLVLWTRSHHGGGDERVIDAPGGELHLYSRDGRVVVGLLPEPAPQRFWGRRVSPLAGEMSELLNGDRKVFFFDLLGWGAAVPHGVLAAMIGVIPAWWWVVHRARTERERRRTMGLCRVCAYDLRAAAVRCPECGTPIGVGKLDRLQPDPPRPAAAGATDADVRVGAG